MKFTLLSLKHGWLDAKIEHNEEIRGICASNNFGGDFPADLMTVLYESISGKVPRMVGWTNENSDFGLLVEPLPDGTYRIADVGIIYWGDMSFTDPELENFYYREAMKILEDCRVYDGTVQSNPSLYVDTIGIITEEQILDFARSFLAEFTKFFGKIGRRYYDIHWFDGSDHWGKLIDEYPFYEFMQLSILIDQKTKELQAAAG